MKLQQGTLFTISAPSGAGKTSLVAKLIESNQHLKVSVSHTTRAIRRGEVDGVNYHFVNPEQFKAMLVQGNFLESAKVFDNFYGTSQQWVTKTLEQGDDVMLEIDWQGAAQVRRLLPHTVSIFVLPPSRDALEHRLRGRGQDNEAVIASRLAEAKTEMTHYPEADYLVINDEFERAQSELAAIILSQRLKTHNQQRRHSELLQELLS